MKLFHAVARILLLSLCALTTPAEAALNQLLQIVGSYSYIYTPGAGGTGGTIQFGVGQLTNPITTRTTGTLRLEFWIFPNAAYTGVEAGYRMATAQLTGSSNGTLPPNTSFTNVAATASVTANPPSGTYYASLLVSEYNTSSTASDHFTVLAYANFPTPFVLGTASNQSASTSVASGGTGTGSTFTLHEGAIFSSAQVGSQSYLRFYNTGTTAGTVTVTLSDYSTGQTLTTWTSPSIAAGAAPQYGIATIEAGLSSTLTKPAYYGISVQSQITGFMQHVLYHPADGTLTNLSTCDAGITDNSQQVANVHSALLATGFPSTIVVTNTGASASGLTLGIYDARDGSKVGSYPVAPISAGGQAIIPVTTMEAGGGITPSGGLLHYVVKVDTAFTGYLQHLVNNQQAGVVTNMTNVCALNAIAATTAATTLHEGAIFSSVQAGSQSYLRFYNTGTSAGTVSVTLSDSSSGQTLTTWTSPSIAAGAAPQYGIATIESAATAAFTKPSYYGITVQPQIGGYMQHVLYHPVDGTLTNLTTCDTANTANAQQVANVHSALLANGFPSSIAVYNTGTSAGTVTLGIYDARDGSKVGSYVTTSIPANGQVIVPVTTMENSIGLTPSNGLLHYVIKVDSNFTGYLQHLVNNQKAGVVTDMTTVCAMAAGTSAGGGTTGGASGGSTGGSTVTLTLSKSNTCCNGFENISANPSGDCTVGCGNFLITNIPRVLVFPVGTSVTLTPNGTSATGASVFQSWGGACSGTVPSCTLVMNANMSVSANWYIPIAGNWSGTWSWSGPGSNGCTNFTDGGALSLSIAQNASALTISNISAAGVQVRDDSTCSLTSTQTDNGGSGTGTLTGTAIAMTLNYGGAQLVFNFTGTITPTGNSITGTLTRVTGGSGTFTLTKH